MTSIRQLRLTVALSAGQEDRHDDTNHKPWSESLSSPSTLREKTSIPQEITTNSLGTETILIRPYELSHFNATGKNYPYQGFKFTGTVGI